MAAAAYAEPEGSVASRSTGGSGSVGLQSGSKGRIDADERTHLPSPRRDPDPHWRTVDEIELATAGVVHFWNTGRLHSACADIPPAEFEAAYHSRLQPATDAA